MARNLSDTIQTMYTSVHSYEYCYHRGMGGTLSNSNTKYMVIPIGEDLFEVPLFALKKFIDTVNFNLDEGLSSIVTLLNTEDRTSDYVTVDRYMRDVLMKNLEYNRLVKCTVKVGNDELIYYGAHGAVFDHEFNPIMICSWQIETTLFESENAEGVMDCGIRYKFKRPVLRVDPNVYLSKSNTMEKFIVNKMIPTCMERSVFPPADSYLGNKFIIPQSIHGEFVKVELDASPFVVKGTDTPSISTTNQQLLQVAIDHIDELIQCA